MAGGFFNHVGSHHQIGTDKVKKGISLTIEAEIMELIEEEASRCDMPRSNFIESILKRHVGNSNIENELATLSRRMANVALGYAQTRPQS